ncbi:MAG: hypothetical protein IJZ62_01395, partial [Clostridia bacterium]|nr:hypothetical protein [Clostridia bacterium]
KIYLKKSKDDIVKILRENGAKTTREIYEEQMLKNSKIKTEKSLDKELIKSKNKENYNRKIKNKERER